MEFQPSVDKLKEILNGNNEINIVPIFLEVSGDLLTPVSTYLKLSAGNSQPSFLLESAESGSQVGRFSFLGFGIFSSIINKPLMRFKILLKL